MTRRYYIETFGCQMNVNDSEKVAGLLQADGYAPAASAREADFVFVNTCAVREKAAEKLYSSLGRLRREGPAQRRIGVGGCVAQLHGREVLERAPQVDVMVGTHNLSRLPALLRQAGGGAPVVDLDRRADAFDVPPSAVAHGSSVRAFVTAIEGCNHVCSFCVVPRTRGPEVCRPVADVVSEVAGLVRRGFAEVMLLGQTVNAYRHGQAGFADLLEEVHAIPGLRRLRFTTSHPSHVDRRLARAFAELPRLCPYLHLPVQSGSDRILASMRRGYGRQQYEEALAMLREECPGLALSSDVIVGYPGETEADFEATLDLIERARFDGLFAFKYSPRPGTTALRLTDDVSEAEKSRRLSVVNERQQRWQAELNRRRVGGVEEVLFESAPQPGRLSGRTPDFRIVHCEAGPCEVGHMSRVEIVGSGANSLQGRIVD